MASEDKYPTGNVRKFNKWLVEQYFKYGSVDEVLRRHRFDVPISYAQYQRILDKWGVVKTAGPNNKITEALEFFANMAEKNTPLEELYKHMPPSFKTSAATMYRILGYIKEGITRRMGTALILTPYNNEKKVLVATDISTPRIELGKPYGSVSIPMGFSRKRDLRKNAIMRVLQQEVFTDLAIAKRMPDIIPDSYRPFMFLDVADVRVEIFHLILPKKYSSGRIFTSYKLKDYKFVSIKSFRKTMGGKMRVGVAEAIDGYKKYLELKDRNLTFNPLQYRSELNYYLAKE